VSSNTGTPVTVELALVSHTNSGKTTLARTLLGRDVGEVRDAPHVTELAEPYLLLETASGDALRLWDTPGFGDSARLVQRLRMSGNPIGWLLREVWDRHRDRPFWCSQQAVRAARSTSDVVLYLVNASEQPRDAGYVASEIQVLRWIDKPVLVLLNQVGPPRPHADDAAEQERWRSHIAGLGLACDVLTLDAFARCWVQEGTLLAAVSTRLAPEKREGFARMQSEWTARNVERFETCMQALAEQIATAAHDSETIDEPAASIGSRMLVTLGLRKDGDARAAEPSKDCTDEQTGAHRQSAGSEIGLEAGDGTGQHATEQGGATLRDRLLGHIGFLHALQNGCGRTPDEAADRDHAVGCRFDAGVESSGQCRHRTAARVTILA
jgi:hypothetical protein